MYMYVYVCRSSSSGHGGSSSGSGGTFEKNFGVSKETLLHGSYADYIKEYTARSSRTAGQVYNAYMYMYIVAYMYLLLTLVAVTLLYHRQGM